MPNNLDILLHRYLISKVPSYPIPNIKTETENVHIYYGIQLSCKENEFMKFAGKWMDLEKIILNEKT